MNNDYALERIQDTKLYLENFTKIKGKTPGLIPFKLKEAQKDLFNTMNTSNRTMILKARQIGFSTAVTGYYYHKTITTPGVNTALIGYNSDLTAELLDKVKTFINSTPPEMRPTTKYNSKYEVSFPIMNSKIIVLPSTDKVGRGYTLNNLLVTELAFWDKAEEKMYALEASVPIDGSITIESTPNMVGNLYHRMWVSDDNGYAKNKYGWWWNYTEEEVGIIRKRMNNPIKFAQEYELEFLSTGRPVFDQKVVRDQRKNMLVPGDKRENEDLSGDVFTVYEDNWWTIYKEPEENGIYVMGVDTSEGVEGGDYSVAVIWDRKTGEEVAMYRRLIAPDLLGEELVKMGRKYNNALIVVEINNHGLTTLTILKQKIYPSLYFRPTKIETIGTSYSDKLGWKTTKVTRPLLIDDFAQAMRDKEIIIHSKKLLDEMMVFVYDNANNMISQPGFHDDCIFAAAIGFQGFKIIHDGPLTQLNTSSYSHIDYGY